MAQKTVLYNNKAAVDLDSDEGWNILSGPRQDEDKADLKLLFKCVPWLFRGVTIRADAVAAMPFKITALKGDKDVDTSAAYANAVKFLPDPRRLLWLIEASLTLEAKAYIHKGKNAAQLPAKLKYFAPQSLTLDTEKATKTGEIAFRRTVSGTPEEYTGAEVVHLWALDPYVELGPGSASPGAAAFMASGVIYAVDEFAKLYAERGFVKAFILTVKGVKDEAERDRIEDWLNTFMRGVKNAFRFKIFNADTAAPVVVGEGMNELEKSAITDSRREDIAAALGIPQSILFSGSASGLGGGGVATQDEVSLYKLTIIPECQFIADGLNEQLFHPAGYHWEFLPETLDIFQEDEAQRATAWNTFMDAVLKCPTEELCLVSLAKLGYEIDDDWTGAIHAYYVRKEADAARLAEQAPGGDDEGGDREENPEPEDAEAKADLRRWKTKALKALARGNGAGVPFESDAIPPETHARITKGLPVCADEAAIKALFDGELRAKAEPPYTALIDKLVDIRQLLLETA